MKYPSFENFRARRLLRLLPLAVVLLCDGSDCNAQELNCQVEMNTDQVQTTNKSVFETLKEAVTEYMNETHFTNLQYSTNAVSYTHLTLPTT